MYWRVEQWVDGEKSLSVPIVYENVHLNSDALTNALKIETWSEKPIMTVYPIRISFMGARIMVTGLVRHKKGENIKEVQLILTALGINP